MDVYKASAFEDRVNYAASVISKGVVFMNARHFDTCFEMGDQDYVGAAIMRRVLKNPSSKLATNLPKFLNVPMLTDNYEKTKHLSRKALQLEAIQVCVEGCKKIGYTNL